MKWFKNLKISHKLLINAFMAIFVVIALTTIGFFSTANLGELQDEGHSRNQDAALAQDVAAVGNRMYAVIADSIINRDLENSAEEWEEVKKISLKELEEVLAVADTAEEKAWVNESSKLLNNMINLYEKKVLPRIQYSTGVSDDIRAVDGQLDELIDNINNLLTKFSNSLLNEATEADNNFDKTSENALITNIIISVVAGIVLILFSLWLINGINKPLKELTEAADRLALGDVNINVVAKSKDEIGSLMESFGKMILNIRGQALAAEKIAAGDLTVEVEVKSENDLLGKKLSEMVGKNNVVLNDIYSASEQVATGAKQISDSSIALSQGAAEQASTIEQLTASVEEISSQTKQNAQNADEANKLAESAKTDALQGNTQMKEMLKAMEEINYASSNISKIIKVIDEIAFQTNILALNAAVEAARAGQHGKGFAVVAEEVRNLAARSAKAASETTDMIEGSIKKAEEGTKIASDTAEALNGIVEVVSKVANLIGDIAIASNEQASGITQINQGIMQVSQVVQTNSATSEEGAAASEELATQADFLKQQANRFKLKEGKHSLSKEGKGINPEVLKMLESMHDKKGNDIILTENEALANRAKIALGEKEFGKY